MSDCKSSLTLTRIGHPYADIPPNCRVNETPDSAPDNTAPDDVVPLPHTCPHDSEPHHPHAIRDANRGADGTADRDAKRADDAVTNDR